MFASRTLDDCKPLHLIVVWVVIARKVIRFPEPTCSATPSLPRAQVASIDAILGVPVLVTAPALIFEPAIVVAGVLSGHELSPSSSVGCCAKPRPVRGFGPHLAASTSLPQEDGKYQKCGMAYPVSHPIRLGGGVGALQPFVGCVRLFHLIVLAGEAPPSPWPSPLSGSSASSAPVPACRRGTRRDSALRPVPRTCASSVTIDATDGARGHPRARQGLRVPTKSTDAVDAVVTHRLGDGRSCLRSGIL